MTSPALSPIVSPSARQLERKAARSRASTVCGFAVFVRFADVALERPPAYPPTTVETSPTTRAPEDPTCTQTRKPARRALANPQMSPAGDQRSPRAGAPRSASPAASRLRAPFQARL